jgi:hypothetical protein
MVRINKNQLTTQQIDDLFTQLAKVVAPTQATHANAALSEILGREEKLMLAKRIAAIVLLHEGVSHYKISHTLKLSASTVATIAERKAAGHYTTIISTITKNRLTYQRVLDALDTILSLGGILPAYGQASIGMAGFKKSR